MPEGCLSIPEVFVKIPRPQKIKVEVMNEIGKRKTLEVEGIIARVLQHKIEHLNGILIVDHASRDKKNKISKKLEQLANYTQSLVRIQSNKMLNKNNEGKYELGNI